MTVQMSASFLVMMTGGVVYLMGPGPRTTELARIAFFVGLFWLVFAVGRASVHL